MFHDIAVKCDCVNANLLGEWYTLDGNTVPPTYQLQSITSRFPHYNDHSHPDLCSQDQAAWWQVFSELQQLLWRLAEFAVEQGLMSSEEGDSYRMSGTVTSVSDVNVYIGANVYTKRLSSFWAF